MKRFKMIQVKKCVTKSIDFYSTVKSIFVYMHLTISTIFII